MFTGTTLCPKESAAMASSGVVAGAGVEVDAAGASTASSSIGDMTSASDRPRLALFMGDLLYPGPDGTKLSVGISGGDASHLADTSAL